MKSNSLLALLVGALCVCGLATLWVSVRYYFSAKELQELHGHVLTINRTRNAVQSLALEAVRYSQANPALLPLLRQYELAGQRPATNAPPPELSDPNLP